ncbi:MAG: transglutaminase-like domain-containing protein [Bacteroidota bacterium]
MRSDQNPLWRILPLLAGELVVASASLAALTLAVDEPLYEGLVHTAVVVGLIFSALGMRRRGMWALPGVLVVFAALVFRLGTHVLPGASAFFPPEIAANDDLTLAALVGWFMVAFSFWQTRRTNLVFMIVCGLAIFGLVGTVNLNSETLVTFAVFICGAVFCWGYEQFLDMQDRLVAAGEPDTAGWQDMARGQLSVAVLIGLLTFGLGSAVGTGAYRATPNMYAKMTERAYGWTFNRGLPSIFNSFSSNFRVGPGPVRLSDTEVMRVQADRAGLWRGMAYDYYDGHEWSRTGHGGARLLGNGVDFRLPTSYFPQMKSWRANVQRITLASRNGIIFGAAEPVAIRVAEASPGSPASRFVSPAVDSYGCLSWVFGPGGSRDEYWILSHEPVNDPTALRAASSDYSDYGFEPYLQVPAIARAALGPLVTQITADAATPYDKVQALQKYVEDKCLYTLNAPAAPRGAGDDAVDWFLNHSQRGACDLFSSSLAVMARIAGIPARVVTGYATGDYDHETRSFIVKGRDAHAWTEIYFNGHGWVSFDPQARQQYDGQSVVKLLTSGHWRLGVREVAHDTFTFVLIACIGLVALAAFVDPLQLLRRLAARKSQSPLVRLSAEYQAFYTLLMRKAGFTHSAGMTPQEAVTAIMNAPPSLRVDRRRLQTLNERFYHLRYSDDASFGELAGLRQELRSLRRHLKRR